MKKKKLHTIFWWIGSGIVVVVLLLQTLFFFFGDQILRESILTAFREYTKGQFYSDQMPQLDYGRLRLNLLGGGITINDLVYQNGRSISDSLGADYTQYRISVPTFSISGLHLWETYQNRQIQLKSIYLESPKVSIVPVRTTSESDSTSEEEQLQQVINEQQTRIYNSIRKYLDELSLGKLEIANATFLLDRRQQPINLVGDLSPNGSDWFVQQLTIVLQNFKIDTQAWREKQELFSIEETQLKLGGYRLVLPDSSYAIVVDTLSFSTERSKLSFQNAELTPLTAQDSAKWYSLTVPLLEITGINPSDIYRKKAIVVDSLKLRLPRVKGYRRTAATSENSADEPSPYLSQVHPDTLYRLISDQWREVAVNHFTLTDGQVQLFEVDDDTISWLDIPQHSLSFKNFRLDSTVQRQQADAKSTVLPMDSIDWQGENIRLWFANFQHYFTVDRLQVQTNQQNRYTCNLIFDSARVQPRVDSLYQFLTDSQPPNVGYDIRTSQVMIFGIDLQELASTKFADIDSIQVRQPEIAVANFSDTPFRDLPRQKLSDTASSTETTVKQVIYNWSHARLNLYPVVAPNRADAWLEQMLVRKLKLDQGHIEIREANPRKDGFTKIAYVNRFQGYYENVSIGNEAHPLIAIDDAQQYSSRVAVFADEVEMAMMGSWFQFPYNRSSAVSGGWLEAREVALSTLDSRGYVRDVTFWPNRSANRVSPSKMEQMEIPYFAIEGINFGELYNLQLAELDRISLVSPTIRLKVGANQKEVKGGFSMPELYEQVEPYLDQLSVSELKIEQANITLESDEPEPEVLFSTPSFSVQVVDFLLDEVTTVIPERPFYAREARIGIDQFDFSIPVDGEQEYFAAERFLYSSYSDQLTIDNLRHVTDSIRFIGNTTDLSVSQLALHRMNFYRYFTKNEMAVEKVIVRQPNISVITQKRETKQSSKPSRMLQAEIYPKIKSVTKGIYLDLLSVERGKMEYLQQGADTDTLHYWRADTIRMQAHRLAIDSTSDRREATMLFADAIDYHIHVKDYLLRLPEANQSIQVDEILMSNQRGSILLSNLEIQPYGFSSNDLSTYPSKNLLSLSAPSLQIAGLDVNRAFTRSELSMQQVHLTDPAITVYQFVPDSLADDSSPKKWSELASPYLQALSIDQVNFTNGAVKVFQNKSSDLPAFESQRLDVKVTGLQVDSVSYRQFVTNPLESENSNRGNITRKLLLADDLLVKVRDYRIALSDTLYTAQADQISLSTKHPQLNVSGFSLTPRIARNRYREVFPFQKTRVAARIGDIRLTGIDFEKLIKHRHLRANSLLLNRVEVDAYKDARVPRNSEKILPMHQDMLLNLNFLLTLDTIRVANSLIRYAERVPEASKEGIITFEQLNATLLNATNHPKDLADSTVFSMKVSTKVMGKSELKAVFKFPMADQNNRFTINGTLDSMNLQAINPILQHAAFVYIRDGWANSMRFYIQGDQQRAQGELRFNYNDLSIMLVDKSKGRPGIDERVGSLIANAFVVKSDNPKAIRFRVGEIDYEHDSSRSIFSYWWRSLLSGIKSSIGMQPVAERIREEAIIE